MKQISHIYIYIYIYYKHDQFLQYSHLRSIRKFNSMNIFTYGFTILVVAQEKTSEFLYANFVLCIRKIHKSTLLRIKMLWRYVFLSLSNQILNEL